MTTTYCVQYLSYACDDGIAERVIRSFTDCESAWRYADRLSDDGTIDGVSMYAESRDDDEFPF